MTTPASAGTHGHAPGARLLQGQLAARALWLQSCAASAFRPGGAS
ncbi:hypothetical protein [Streptomyces sp. NPDC056883]